MQLEPQYNSAMSVLHSCTGQCHHAHGSPYDQTLEELDFQRGLWASAMDGDVAHMRRLLDKGRDPNGVDKSGYTALVCLCMRHASLCMWTILKVRMLCCSLFTH